MKAKEKQVIQPVSVVPARAEVVKNAPQEMVVRTKGRYISGGFRWGRGMAMVEYELWKLFWGFLIVSAVAGAGLGVGISTYYGLGELYGWWAPAGLSFFMALLIAWLIIPLFYRVLVPWYVAHREVKGSEQS